MDMPILKSNKDIINNTNYIENIIKEFNEIGNDYGKTIQFYNNYFDFINLSFEKLYDNVDLSQSILDFIYKFLDFCISNEENGLINNNKFQLLFNEFKYNFESNGIQLSDENYNKFKVIVDRKNNIINKIDTDADNYRENDYLSRTQVLNLGSNNNKRHGFTSDEDNNNYGGFIVTSIVLQASLVLSLIISLIILFK